MHSAFTSVTTTLPLSLGQEWARNRADTRRWGRCGHHGKPLGTSIGGGIGAQAAKRVPIVAGQSLTLIMTHKTPNIRPAMTAIAAVLALSSTALLAQTAPEATPPVTEAPATAVPESAPAATTVPEAAPPATAVEPSATIASDPIATTAEPTTTRSSKSTTTRRTVTVARPARAAAPVARAAVAAPDAAPAPAVEAAPVPIVAIPADPPAVAATPPAQDASIDSNTLLPIAAAAGLGLLGLIGLGVAMRRRKRRNEEEEFAAVDQTEPAFEAPAPADPLFAEYPTAPRSVEPAPAFILGAAPAAASTSAGSSSDCTDAPPGSHVEAACEGPTADNPSLSIKKRLKRAHFFDQREFLAEAGEVAPMAADAGLPGAAEEPAPPPAPGTRDPA